MSDSESSFEHSSDLEEISSEGDIALLPRDFPDIQEPVISENVKRFLSIGAVVSFIVTCGLVVVVFSLLIQSSAVVLVDPDPANTTSIWLGNGCFWERQFAYVMLELDPQGVFKRPRQNVSSIVGYAGSLKKSQDYVCYHHSGGAQWNDYDTLGHTEVTKIVMDDSNRETQFTTLIKDFFGSFVKTNKGYMRPDPADVGGQYRSVIGIPGGESSSLYPIVVQNCPKGMILKPDYLGSRDDELSVVWIMDSTLFPFYRAEVYHQFHDHFSGPGYGQQYNSLKEELLKSKKIGTTGCPEK